MLSDPRCSYETVEVRSTNRGLPCLFYKQGEWSWGAQEGGLHFQQAMPRVKVDTGVGGVGCVGGQEKRHTFIGEKGTHKSKLGDETYSSHSEGIGEKQTEKKTTQYLMGENLALL